MDGLILKALLLLYLNVTNTEFPYKTYSSGFIFFKENNKIRLD